jgi:DNA polymerase (family X)
VPAADTQTVAQLLREYAQRTALRGGNPYRAKAYSRAADSLAALAVPLHVFVAENRLSLTPAKFRPPRPRALSRRKGATHADVTP